MDPYNNKYQQTGKASKEKKNVKIENENSSFTAFIIQPSFCYKPISILKLYCEKKTSIIKRNGVLFGISIMVFVIFRLFSVTFIIIIFLSSRRILPYGGFKYFATTCHQHHPIFSINHRFFPLNECTLIFL